MTSPPSGAIAAAILVLIHLLVSTTVAKPEAEADDDALSCEVARLKCAYRSGCLGALQNYASECSDVISSRSQRQRCPERCQEALVALVSTDEGSALTRCRCEAQDGGLCSATKRRLEEACSADVAALAATGSVVTCSTARSICAADATCATALDYFRRLCRATLSGRRRKCTARCRNSFRILLRQRHAQKLRTCRCDGSEEFDCSAVKRNTQSLCFPGDVIVKQPEMSSQTPRNVSVASASSSHMGWNHIFVLFAMGSVTSLQLYC